MAIEVQFVRSVPEPLGTTRTATVGGEFHFKGAIVVCCIREDDPTIGHMCIFRPGESVPPNGTRVRLTVVQSAVGRFWQLSESLPNTEH